MMTISSYQRKAITDPLDDVAQFQEVPVFCFQKDPFNW